MTEPDDADDGARSLDVDHVADLANLPVREGERDQLEDAMADVLEAFQLPEVDEPEDEAEPVRLFDDEAEAWPEPGVEAIVREFPDRDGRILSP